MSRRGGVHIAWCTGAGNESILDGVKEILISVGKLKWLDFVIVSAFMLKELRVWRHLHQMEMLQ